MSNQTNNKVIAKNTLMLYIRMGLVLIVSLFTTRVVIKSLGVEDYGIYNVVCGFVSMFAFLNTSMVNSVQRYYNFSLGSKNTYSIKDVYNTALQTQLTLSIVLLILLESLGLWYLYDKMVIPADRFDSAFIVYQCSIISMLFVVMQIPYSAAIVAYQRINFYAYLSIFEVFAKLCLAYVLSNYHGDRLTMYGYMTLATTIICFIGYYLFAKKHFKELSFEFKFKKEVFRSMVSFSGWNIFGTFAYMMKGQGLNMLLNLFCGPIINAARGVSGMIMSAIQGFQSNIVLAFRPQLVQSYAAGDNTRVISLFYSMSRFSFVLLSILSLPVILEIDYILSLWLGSDIPDYTSIFTILILVNMIVSSLTTPVSQVVHATGKIRNYQILTSIIVCSIVPLSWVFMHLRFDPTSVYWVSLVVTIINQVVCMLLLKKVFEYSIIDYSKKVLIPCAGFIIASLCCPLIIKLIMPDDGILRLLIVSFLSIIMSLFAAYYIVLDSSEKNMVLTFIKNKLKIKF